MKYVQIREADGLRGLQTSETTVFWYSRTPWAKADLYYAITFRPVEGNPDQRWINVRFRDDRNLTSAALEGVRLDKDQEDDDMGIYVKMGNDSLNDNFANRIAEMLRQFIRENHACSRCV